jgi:hypothetical protein
MHRVPLALLKPCQGVYGLAGEGWVWFPGSVILESLVCVLEVWLGLAVPPHATGLPRLAWAVDVPGSCFLCSWLVVWCWAVPSPATGLPGQWQWPGQWRWVIWAVPPHAAGLPRLAWAAAGSGSGSWFWLWMEVPGYECLDLRKHSSYTRGGTRR